MHTHRGVQCSTLLIYRPHVLALLAELGMCPERFEAAQLHTHILAYAQRRSVTLAKKRLTAMRMFLRFLIATIDFFI